MPNVIVTGGSGLIGTALTGLLISKGYQVTVLTRKPKQTSNGVHYSVWNPDKQAIDEKVIAEADFVVHLAGEGVADKRWTTARKREILESRTRSGEFITKSIKEYGAKIKALISASAIGWYGPDPVVPNPKPFTEDAPVSNDFLGSTCRLWEDSVAGAAGDGRRLVILRTGIVLSTKGGALKEFLKPVSFGVAAILGSGEQRISWIHISDMCRIYLMAIEDGKMNGVFNAVAPEPVSNQELNLKLASGMKGKFHLPVHVPTFALKLALGEMSIEVLKSTTVSSAKIQSTGFQFQFPTIDAALGNLIKEIKQ